MKINKNLKSKKYWLICLTMVLVLGLAAVVNNRFAVNAHDAVPIDHEHRLSYSQEELAYLITQAVDEETDHFDYDRLYSMVDAFLEETITADEFEEGELSIEEWLAEVLEGLVPLGDIIEGNGYFGVLAMDVENKELQLLAFNTSDKNHRFELEVEDIESTPASSEVFGLMEEEYVVSHDVAGRDITISLLALERLIVASEIDRDEDAFTEEDVVAETEVQSIEDAEEFFDDVNEDNEMDHLDASDDIEETEDELLDEIETGDDEAIDDDEEDDVQIIYEIELQAASSNKKAQGAYAMILQAGEFGQINLRTGMINGGSAADHLSVETGASSNNSRNVLKVYSASDADWMEADTDRDFVTYVKSGKSDNVFYEIDETYVLDVFGNAGSASSYFYIELHNSQPVTIQQYLLTRTSSGVTKHTYIDGKTNGAVLNILNRDSYAMTWNGELVFSGDAELNVHSDTDYAMYHNQYDGNVTLSNGFALNMGGKGGIYSSGKLTLSENSHIQLQDSTIAADKYGIYMSGAISLTNSLISIEAVDTENGDIIHTESTITAVNSNISVSDTTETNGGRIIYAKGNVDFNKTSAIEINSVKTNNKELMYFNGTFKLTNSKLSIHQSSVLQGQQAVYIKGNATLNDADLEVDSLEVENGDIFRGDASLDTALTNIRIENSKANSGIRFDGLNNKLITTDVKAHKNNIDDYVIYLKTTVATANQQITDCNFDIDLAESTGGGIYIDDYASRTHTFINTNVKIAGYNNEKPLMFIGNGIIMGRTGNYASSASTFELLINGDETAEVLKSGTLVMHQDSQIKIERLGNSDTDTLVLSGNVMMNDTSDITIDSESTGSRNMVVTGKVTMKGTATMHHTSNLVGKAGDVNGANDEIEDEEEEDDFDDGDDDDDDDGSEETGSGNDEDIIEDNLELSSHKNDTQAVVYISKFIDMIGKGNYVEISGNADRQTNEVNGTPYGLITRTGISRVRDGGYLKIDNVRVGGLFNDLRADYAKGSTEYDTVGEITTNTGKSRVYARGSYVGIICMDYFRILRSSNVYAEGGTAGVMTRRTTTLYPSFGAKEGSTIFSIGVNEGSAGFVVAQDVRFHGSIRVIAEGDQYGVLLTEKSSRVYVHHDAELIAVGRNASSTGVYSRNLRDVLGTIRVETGGYLYAFGGMHGIFAENTNVLASGSGKTHTTTILAIGGVLDKSLSHTFDQMNYMYEPFKVYDLPYPVLAEGNRGVALESEDEIEVPGVVEYGRDESSGIITGGSRKPYIRANRYCNIVGIGGDYGVANTSEAQPEDYDNPSDKGGQIWGNRGKIIGHGGSIGIWSKTRARVSYDGELYGYGEDYGIYSETTLRSYGSGSATNTYMYGIGKINGLYAKDGYEADTYAKMVGETWIDTNAAKEDAMGRPAVEAENKKDMMVLANNSLLHEVYNTINMEFTYPDPYQLNVEFDAVGRNMGSQAEEIVNYNWTTPTIDLPTVTEFGERIYIDSYGSMDDQRLLYAGSALTAEGLLQYGLISTGYKQGTTIVASSNNLKHSGSVTGKSSNVNYHKNLHRMTFRNATVRDLRTVEVEINFKEVIGSNYYDVKKLPEGLSFELDFIPLYPDGYDEAELPLTITIDDSDSYHYDRESGKLTFYKLRQGEYVLRAIDQYGWPYQDLPEIPFVVGVDTRNDANGPGGSSSNWSEANWIENVFVGYYAEQADGSRIWKDLESHKAKVAGRTVINPDKSKTPSFYIPDGPEGAKPGETYEELYNKPSNYRIEVEVYYHRYQYDVDVRAVDRDNHQTLGIPTGSAYGIYYKGFAPDGSSDTSIARTKVTHNGTGYGATYTPVKMYAGLVYQIDQTRAQTNYSYNNAPHDIRIMYDVENGTHYIDDVGEPNYNEQYYSFVTEGEELVYHVWARNDYTGTTKELDIHLVDADDSNTLLLNGEFELYSNFNGVNSEYYKDNTLVDNGDGTFTFTYRRNAYYRLYQVETQSGYLLHEGFYAFSGSNVTSFKLVEGSHQVELIDNKTGWENGSSEPIIISNKYNLGNVTIDINAEGLWSGHDDAVFIVELRNIDEDADHNPVFYQNVTFEGSTSFQDFRSITQTEYCTFTNIPRGQYEVNVYSALRTDGYVKTKTLSVNWGGAESEASFTFINVSEHLLSGADSSTSEFTIINE